MSSTVKVSPEQAQENQEFLEGQRASGNVRYIKRHSKQARITHDVTIICCIVPTRLRRSGPQMNWSCNRPVRPPMTTANTAETMTGICNICVPAYAMRPPSVTCSPWENELSPVVP